MASSFTNRIVKFVLTSIFLALLTGCSGSAPKPIRVAQAGDQDLDCSEIKEQVINLLELADIKNIEDTHTDNANLSIWIAGQLLLIPFLGMDVTGSAEIERAALIKRIDRLKTISDIKNC